MAKIKVKKVKSAIKRTLRQKRTLEALGLKKNWTSCRTRRYTKYSWDGK
jgi:ribosomal protein L30/L7E